MEVNEEHLTVVIRAKLRQEGVKFWLPPFVGSNGEIVGFPENLIVRYARETNSPESAVKQIFTRLQSHALAKLQAKDLMKSSGIATLFLNIILGKGETKTKEIIKISLDKTTKELKDMLSIDDHQYSCRMIFKGKTLNNETSLREQSVVNTSQIMVLLHTLSNVGADDKEHKEVEFMKEMRDVAEALAKRKGGASSSGKHFYLELNDQHGNKIELPDKERQSLCFAMTLHEKGRALMNNKQFSQCLWLFLEADNEFKNCRSDILQSIDNYALLNLDIVWTYFWLQQLDFLPDAEQRLGECKNSFSRTYGENMERVALHKGSYANEMTLYVRLYLMEAICYFLRGKTQECSTSLDKAEDLIKKLHVDDDKLAQMMAMGFTSKEGRLSLRACSGDVTNAIEFISKRREEHQVRKTREEKERANQKEAKKYKHTVAGNLVDIEKLEALCQMGFEKKLSLLALQQSDNDTNKSLEVLQQKQDVLYEALCSEEDIPPSLIQQFTVMGFPRDHVEDVLRRCNCDVDKCLNELLNSPLPSTSEHKDSSHSSSSSSSDEFEKEIDEKVQETLGELAGELDDEHLNTTLVEETELLNKYRLLITTASK